jgi:hypothetical protein
MTSKMKTFQELPFGDKWRVTRCLVRGEAPSDYRMADAVIELGEKYEGNGPVYSSIQRWLPLAMVVVLGGVLIPANINDGGIMVILYALLAVGSIGHLLFNPAVRPRNVARSLSASRRVAEKGRHEAPFGEA